jgi:hypothetical protein
MSRLETYEKLTEYFVCTRLSPDHADVHCSNPASGLDTRHMSQYCADAVND